MAQTVKTACNAGDSGLIHELGRSSGEGNGKPFQYSCLENSMDSGESRWVTVYRVTESDTTEQLTLTLFFRTPNMFSEFKFD